MSRNEWERITLTLPAAEVAGMKKALREVTNRIHAEVKAEAVRLHKSFGTRSIKLYAQKLNEAQHAMYRERQTVEDRNSGWGLMMVGTLGGGYRDPYAGRKAARDRAIAPYIIQSLAFEVLEYGILRGAQPSPWEKREPTPIHQPTTADVARVVPLLTNKDTKFSLFDAEGVIVIDGRKIYYGSGENNHAAEHARDSILGKVFFEFLSQVRWTGKNTGGFGLGNDEYNEDAGREYSGGGGSYLTGEWGPLGEKARQDQTNGHWVRLDSHWG